MTPDELDLLHGYLNASLGDADFARLQSLLRENADARRTLRALSTVDVKLHQVAATNPATLRLLAEPSAVSKSAQVDRSPAWFGWLQWRPLAAAAAGIVFGLLCASVAWAVTSPRAMATAERLFALVDGSFEKGSARVASGFPSEFGEWSGDEAEAVAGWAKDGKQALRFVRAEGDPAVPNSRATACDILQLVDLRDANAGHEGEDAILELSAAFRDARPAKGPQVRFACRLFVFTGDPSRVRDEWPLTMRDSLAAGAGNASSLGGAPQQWQVVTAKAVLPAKAEFAVVQIVVMKAAPSGQAAEFGEQFADDIRLTLKTQPKLPVRVAQR